MIYIQRKEHIANGILTLGIIHFVLFLLCNYFSVETKACPELQLSQVMEYSTEKILEENCFSLQLGLGVVVRAGQGCVFKVHLGFSQTFCYAFFTVCFISVNNSVLAVGCLQSSQGNNFKFRIQRNRELCFPTSRLAGRC